MRPFGVTERGVLAERVVSPLEAALAGHTFGLFDRLATKVIDVAGKDGERSLALQRWHRQRVEVRAGHVAVLARTRVKSETHHRDGVERDARDVPEERVETLPDAWVQRVHDLADTASTGKHGADLIRRVEELVLEHLHDEPLGRIPPHFAVRSIRRESIGHTKDGGEHVTLKRLWVSGVLRIGE